MSFMETAVMIDPRFREMLLQTDPELFAGLAEELEGGAPQVSVRVNAAKEGAACPVVAGAEPVPWCADGFYLPERPDFTLDAAMHQGRYYVQDASSMITERVVGRLAALLDAEGLCDTGEPLRYLDACAAPGGKTTAAVAALPKDALVVANEFDFRRAEILKENVIKWGSGNVAVSRGDTARFRRLPGFFHIVAADVPCSGEGMMRKDMQARSQWSPALVEECASRQREIVGNLWEALAPGGYFIYSTCTFNRTENEEMMARMAREFGAEPLDPAQFFDPVWGIVAPEGMMRFLPTRLRGEGLAMGVLRKPDDAPCAVGGSKKRREGSSGSTRKKGAPLPASLLDWIDTDCTLVADGEGNVSAVQRRHAPHVARLRETLDLICCGTELAQPKGKGYIPSHPLAMSTSLRPDAFPSVEVDLETALSYLRRESLPGVDAPRGAVILTYGGYPLGFVNNLGNRANNLYPQPWRILKR